MLVTIPSPIPELQHAPYPFKMLRAWSVPQVFNLFIVYYFILILSLSKRLGARHILFHSIPLHFNFCQFFYRAINSTNFFFIFLFFMVNSSILTFPFSSIFVFYFFKPLICFFYSSWPS
jgi:hypothetical protein